MIDFYKYCLNNQDYKRVDKILANKTLRADTYWDYIRILTKNVKSDHAIKRWQILAENVYKLLYN